MTQALITELGRVSSARVISRQSVMQYKGSKKALQEIARELNVDAVLEGAIERSGDRVRITVSLNQTSPERQLWAKQYDSSIRDVMVLEDEIARAVTDEIKIKVTAKERTTVSTHARQKNILERVSALEAAQNSPSFAERYTELISAAASHMTLLAPFIPGLKEMMRNWLGK
jgi:hypothetical protein